MISKDPSNPASLNRIEGWRKSAFTGGLSGLSVLLLASAQVTISQFVGSRPASGSALTADSLCLSQPLSLSAPPPLACVEEAGRVVITVGDPRGLEIPDTA